jgi:opine dehydrogenase
VNILKKLNKCAIIGAGNAGYTLAAHLKLLGCKVSLYDIVDAQLKGAIDNDNTIILDGTIEVKGNAKIDLITKDLGAAIKDAELLICVTPAHTHKYVAKDLAKHLVTGQVILLHPGRTGGALEVQKILKDNKCEAEVVVVEAQTLLYACRKDGATVNVFGVKEKVTCAAIPKEKGHEFFELLEPFLPQFVPAPSIWSTSLENIGMLFHPTPTLMNLGRMESGKKFEYYHEGISPSIAQMIEKLDAERIKVAEALGVKTDSAKAWLERSYGAKGDTLYEALQNNPFYKGIMAPSFSSVDDKKGIRYVIEDVPSGLVPVSELAKKFGVETPAINTIIDLANIWFETDFRAKGRNLKQLGLSEMSLDEIKNL